MKEPVEETVTENLPAPPSVMASLLAGFDAVTTHISLIIFPLALDLLLWFGPHLRISKMIMAFYDQMAAISKDAGSESAQMLPEIKSMMEYLSQHINLLAALRSYPVGVTSLLASRSPIELPNGWQPGFIEIGSPLLALGIILLLMFTGILLGTLYFSAVANATMLVPSVWIAALKDWPRASFNILLLFTFWVTLLIGASVPATCIIFALSLGSLALGRIAMYVIGAAIIWLIFPLLLSPHGIFIKNDSMVAAVKRSVRITRMTLPSTGILFLSIIVISQALDLLWGSAPASSWFTLVGIAGHAFITTSLLASSFIYYKEADQWVQTMLARWSQQPEKQNV